MAIAYDTSGLQTGNAVSSRTVSLAATGADRVAIIAVRWFSGTYDTVTVTVDGNATTIIGAIYENPGDGRFRSALYRYVAPPTSSVSYTATWGGNVDDAVIAVATYTGVDQTTPINGSLGSGWASDTAPTLTVSSATGELVVASMNGMYPTASATEDAGQTERQYSAAWGGNGCTTSLCEKAGAASVTQSWTLGNSGRWSVLAARLAEAAGATASIIPILNSYRMRSAG